MERFIECTSDQKGWIKCFRKFIGWRWFKTPHMFHLFCYLLMMANRKDAEFENIVVKRGQLATGRKKIAADLGISEQSVRSCLTRLESTKEITIETTKRFSLITINKYDAYQPTSSDINQVSNQSNNFRPTNDQPTGNHKQEDREYREDTLKEKENIKEKENFQDPEEVKRKAVALKYFTEEVYEVIKDQDFFLDRYKQAEGHFDEIDAHEVNRTRIVRFGLTDTESKHEKEEYEKRDAKFLEDLVAGKFD